MKFKHGIGAATFAAKQTALAGGEILLRLFFDRNVEQGHNTFHIDEQQASD